MLFRLRSLLTPPAPIVPAPHHPAVPPRVWMELEDAYRGTNGFGGDTAEIYGYEVGDDDRGARLYRIFKLFEELRDCQVWVGATRDQDGERLPVWLASDPIEHRLHVRVKR